MPTATSNRLLSLAMSGISENAWKGRSRKHGLRVMVVAGKPRVRKILKEAALSGGGTTIVAEAGSATEAQVLAWQERPDIVLMDLYVPGGAPKKAPMCGLDAAQAFVRESHVSLVVVVSNAEDAGSHASSADTTLRFLKEGDSGPVPVTLNEMFFYSKRGSMPLFLDIGRVHGESSEQTEVPDTSEPVNEGGSALTYGLGVFAVLLFFSPLVVLHFIVKGCNKLAAKFRSGARPIEVGND